MSDDRAPGLFTTRYYVLFADPPKRDGYLRIQAGGGYERWCPVHAWVHVASKPARDFYSRAIENGDGAAIATADEVAMLGRWAD